MLYDNTYAKRKSDRDKHSKRAREQIDVKFRKKTLTVRKSIRDSAETGHSGQLGD